MEIKTKIENELKSFSCPFDFRIATVGTTARDSHDFSVLPRRTALGYEAINFLVINPDNAALCFTLLDAKVNYIFVDIESKKDIDLMEIALRTVKHSTVISYKPNDTTLEAADMFLRHYFQDDLKNKEVMIYGAGNLGSKLALRLAERGSVVYLSSRNSAKTKQIVEAINYLLPKFSKHSIKHVHQESDLESSLDCLISFTSSSHVILPSFAGLIKENGLALDGGINNFTPQFIVKASERNITCTRLDVRAAFPHTLLYLIPYVKNFYKEIQGELSKNGVRLVAGGIIGQKGDIVVDRIINPTQIVGVANGVGGLKENKDYSGNDRKSIQVVLSMLSQT